MPRPTNSAAVGALVREHREAAGLTQTQLAERIGASRFWVAAFERGKPSAELGLALKAIQAVGLTLHIGPEREPQGEPQFGELSASSLPYINPSSLEPSNLNRILAHATLTKVAESSVTGWPTGTSATTGSPAPTQSPKRRRKL